jgi:hypothetical protein
MLVLRSNGIYLSSKYEKLKVKRHHQYRTFETCAAVAAFLDFLSAGIKNPGCTHRNEGNSLETQWQEKRNAGPQREIRQRLKAIH